MCEIVAGTIDLGQTFLDATGECRLESNSTGFVIEDVIVIGVSFPFIRGECEQVVSLGARSGNLNRALSEAMLDKLQEMAGKQIADEEKGLIFDLHEDIIQKIEE